MLLRSVKKITFLISLQAVVPFCWGADSSHILAGPSGLSSSLGDSMAAYGFDASSSYFNPATIVMQNPNCYLEHTKKNIDAANSWAAIAAGTNKFKYGFSWNHLSLPLSSHRDQAYASLGFKPSAVSYFKFPSDLSVGFNMGLLSNHIADEAASAYFVDAGISWAKMKSDLGYGLGLSGKNLYFSGLKYRDNGEEEKHPREYSFGGFLKKWNVMGLTSIDTVDGHSRLSYGLQFSPIGLIDFRAGFNDTARVGLGINFKNMNINYGYKFGVVTADQSISFNYRWEAPKDPDYTDPMLELEARHKSLEEYLVADLQKNMQSLKVVPVSTILKIIIVQPENEEAWNLLNSMTGEKQMNIQIPRSRTLRRDYLTMAIAYANNDTDSRKIVDNFLKKYSGKKINTLVGLIKKYDFKDAEVK